MLRISSFYSFFEENHILVDSGLTEEEITAIEKQYRIEFPERFRDMLMDSVPIGKGFYNWRDSSSSNTHRIEQALKKPYESLIENVNELVWREDWGEEPESLSEKKTIMEMVLRSAPKVIPIYEHRYVVCLNKTDSPVISIMNTDIIPYGQSIDQYLMHEFCGQPMNNDFNKKQCFWNEIEER